MVQLFTEKSLSPRALWVLFRDSFVQVMMESTQFVDFASGISPFEGVVDVNDIFTQSANSNVFGDNASDKKNLNINEISENNNRKETETFEDDLIFREGFTKHQRPGLLYLIEAIAFNLIRKHLKFGQETPLDASNIIFKVLADMIIHMQLNKTSFDALSNLLNYVPVQSKLFNQLIKSFNLLEINEFFFTENKLNKVIVHFLLTNMQEIFLWISTSKFFNLMLALYDMIEQDESLEISLQKDDKILNKQFFKSKINSILKLQNFVADVQGQLLKLDFEKLKQILLLDETKISTAFFIGSNDLTNNLQYNFDENKFREENITIKNMNYINNQKQAHRMSIFASPISNPSPSQPSVKGSKAALLEQLMRQNLQILSLNSLYHKLRLIIQNNRGISRSKAFQQLVQFLFRNLIKWVIKHPGQLDRNNSQIEEHFHLLVDDCGDLNGLISILLEETDNLNGDISEVLAWVSRSPNDVFLRILIDKFSQVIFEFTRKTSADAHFFSRDKLTEMVDVEDPSNAEICIELIKLYEAHLIHTQSSASTKKEITEDTTKQLTLETPEESHNTQHLTKSTPSRMNILTLIFYLRSELRALIDATSENSPEHMLTLGRFLIKKEPTSTNLKSRVRNSVLIYLLGSLQEKFNFLENQLSKFRPLLPDSLLNSQMHCIRVYNDSLIAKHVIPVSKLIKKLMRNEAVDSFTQLLPQDFYSLAVSIINQQITLPNTSKNNHKVFTAFKKLMNPNQALFLEAIITDFPQHKGVSLRTASEEYLTRVLLFIINVTLSTVTTMGHAWFLPRLMQDLTAGIITRIPFNFKNVLLMDVNMNRLINENNSSAKMYECVNCGTPFSIGNCGNPVLLEKAAKCVNCKQEIGAKEYHKPNDNTREISLEEFTKKTLSSPLYSVHEYLLDETATINGMSRFAFRVGHLLCHALYAGLSITGLLDCESLLLSTALTSHPHLNLSKENLFEYFYKHVRCDLDWLKKELRINELPLEFLNYYLQDIVNSPGGMCIDEDLVKIQDEFGSSIESYKVRLAYVQGRIREKRGKTVSQEVVSEDAIKRNVDFEEVEDDVDRFLFLNLRQTQDLDLLLFSKRLRRNETDQKFELLGYYLDHMVLLLFFYNFFLYFFDNFFMNFFVIFFVIF
jgi:Fe2+ or Zn2+ uptake regulation protein